MLFGEPTLKELISSYLDLRHTSKKFLKETHQIDVILRLRDVTHDHPIEVRNEQLKQAEELVVRNGYASVEVRYQGTHLKTYQAFDIANDRYRPKYFVGWVGNEKLGKDEFVARLEHELLGLLKPIVNCVVFPGLFV